MPDDTVTSRSGVPRLGMSLPSFGPHVGADAIVTVTMAAERLGFDSVSASERLLLPAGPAWRNEAGLHWYRDAGGTCPVVTLVMSSRSITRPDQPAADFAKSATEDLERAAAAGVDEVHFELNLAGVHPGRQVEALEALVSTLGR